MKVIIAIFKDGNATAWSCNTQQEMTNAMGKITNNLPLLERVVYHDIVVDGLVASEAYVPPNVVETKMAGPEMDGDLDEVHAKIRSGLARYGVLTWARLYKFWVHNGTLSMLALPEVGFRRLRTIGLYLEQKGYHMQTSYFAEESKPQATLGGIWRTEDECVPFGCLSLSDAWLQWNGERHRSRYASDLRAPDWSTD